MTLENQHCKPCEGGVAPLASAESKKLLKKTPGWTLERNKIRRTFTFKNFVTAATFLEPVKFLAEREGHHPDIHWSYNKITFELTTHAIKGLSVNDFILAAKINQIAKSLRA